VGGPPRFRDIDMYPHDFGNDLLLPIYVYMLSYYSFLACFDVS